ncbi:cytochrome c biogenesis CcdA family protein [Mycolicibacter heraklionensis]|uniref:Cytochrome c biogenesis CcdA family protein n=1 Tax=Mycolicibacter heraklionensis TaxID=512402 RepID=A0A9X7WHV8_9MYCO|nr:cytochrome c biogenesis CcdA family protein [Mycolicibacter heraklionensis]QZA08416.1 cytochrome c biogenesis CcdA family protein [Mycolicibacter heraklionensis]
MNQNLSGLAFAAGLVAALNPCGFALLPAYLALVVRGERAGGWGAVGRALAATAAMTLGFLTVFGAFGLLTVTVASRVQRYLPYATVVIGMVLVALGVWLLAGRRLAVASIGGRWAPTARIGSMLGYGVGYACASLGCTIGPFLAVTGAAWRGGLDGVVAYLAYAAGFGLLVGVLAMAVALARTALIDRLRRITGYASRISGALLVAVGLYVGYYGYYEIRLFELGGDAADPVLAAAGRLQGALAGWVYQWGAWPWLAALALIGLGALLRARRTRSLTRR